MICLPHKRSAVGLNFVGESHVTPYKVRILTSTLLTSNMASDSAFPSSAAFDLINNAFQANPSVKEESMQSAKAVFQFLLKKDGQVVSGRSLIK